MEFQVESLVYRNFFHLLGRGQFNAVKFLRKTSANKKQVRVCDYGKVLEQVSPWENPEVFRINKRKFLLFQVIIYSSVDCEK